MVDRPARIAAGDSVSAPTCRLCGADLTPHLRRPRDVAAVRELPRAPTSSTRARRSTRCTSGSARRACSSSCRPTSTAEDDLQPLRLLLLLSATPGCAHAEAATSRPPSTRLGLDRGLVRRRGRQQRRLPAAARARPGHPLSRHRAGGEHRGGGPGQGHRRRSCEFLGEATGTAVAAEHGKADLVAANNVFAHVPEHRGLRPRPARSAGGRRHPDASRSRTCCG